jgi:hypothetical protein
MFHHTCDRIPPKFLRVVANEIAVNSAPPPITAILAAENSLFGDMVCPENRLRFTVHRAEPPG